MVGADGCAQGGGGLEIEVEVGGERRSNERATQVLQPTWFVLGRISPDGVCTAVPWSFAA